tara:strand:+ start:404 stop:727 length:324 start_codon:yes stop_codon:yes gene_type:complete
MSKISANGIIRNATTEEQAEIDARKTDWDSKSAERKLEKIREIRNQKLQETDWLVTSEQITNAQKTWRENLRKIPQDYTTEDEYDTLLEVKGEFPNITRKHSIWSKP